MKIVDAKMIVCSPGRNFVTLKIVTEDGIYGLGDATLNGRELAVASYLSDHVIPLLIGRDARRIEDIWQYVYKGAYWRRGPVTMSAISAVDTALWDIKGKALNAPVYQLLGGASREGVLVYGHASGQDIEEAVGAVPELCAAIIRTAAQGIRTGSPFAPRCASPAHAHRSRAARKEPRTLSFVLARRPCSCGVARKFPFDPPAHHHASGGG